MSRRLASKLLTAVIRHSPSGSQCWGNAMLREMDFIESDRAALWWALGSTAAIITYSIPRGVTAWLEKHFGQRNEALLRTLGKKAAGVVLGVVFSIGVLSTCVFSLRRVSPLLFPAWHLTQMASAQFMTVLGIPETTFVIAAVALWRKRRTVSAGILLGAITLMSHFIIYVSTHG